MSVSGLRNGCPHIIQSQRCILKVLSYHSPHIFGTVTYPGGMSALGQGCVTDRHLNCFKRTNHSALFRKCCVMIRSHVLCLSLYTWQEYQGLCTSRAFCIISENTTPCSPLTMEHRSPKISKELQDENVMLAKQLKQTEQYYKRMLEQRDNAIHKLDNEQNRSKELRFKFVAQIKKARRLDELIFELKMKNADMVLALNKAEKKNKNLTAQIADLFNAGEEAFDVPSVSQPTDASVSSDSKTDTVSSHPISPPSSPIAKRTGQVIKDENGTPQKPRNRLVSPPSSPIAKHTGQVIKDKNGTPQKPRKRLVSPPSSSIAKRTGQAVIKQENGAPEKPRKRRLRDTQTSTRRFSQRLKIKQK